MNLLKCKRSNRCGRGFKVLLLTVILKTAFSQNPSSVSGRVISVKTKEPLPGAVVYLANTSIGVYADTDGTFSLQNIPPGKYDLTVSMLGYKSFSKAILLSTSVIDNFLVELEATPTLLDPVTVVARRQKMHKSDYIKFLRYFLGRTVNSRKCKILNPEDVFVFTEHNTLIAEATKPIIVENKALGYLLQYELREFSLDEVSRHIIFAGTPRFEEMKPSTDAEKKKWIKERDRAYFGSTQHFLRSLKSKELAANFYRLSNASGEKLNPQQLMKDSLIIYSGKVFVSFEKEPSDANYPSRFNANRQESSIEFMGKPITVYANGYFEDFRNLFFDGYFAWSSVLAELLPLGYQPTRQLQKNK